MPLEHLQSLHGSTKKFQFTDDQWRHIIRENQTSIDQIASVDARHQSTALDPQQLSALIEQNNRSIAIDSSTDRSRLYLNTQQILSLARHSKINSDLWILLKPNQRMSVISSHSTLVWVLMMVLVGRIPIHTRAVGSTARCWHVPRWSDASANVIYSHGWAILFIARSDLLWRS